MPTLDDIIAEIKFKGQTRLEGQPPQWDAMLVEEVERLRQDNQRLREILDQAGMNMQKFSWDTPRPALGWAAIGPQGQISVNSVRGSQDGVRLAVGECTPVRVTISYKPEPDEKSHDDPVS